MALLNHLKDYSVVEDGNPVLGGHIMNKFAGKYGTVNQVINWANRENDKNYFPSVSKHRVRKFRKKFLTRKLTKELMGMCRMTAHIPVSVTPMTEPTSPTPTASSSAPASPTPSSPAPSSPAPSSTALTASKEKRVTKIAFENLKNRRNFLHTIRCLKIKLSEYKNKINKYEKELESAKIDKEQKIVKLFLQRRKLGYDCICSGVALSIIPRVLSNILKTLDVDYSNISLRTAARMVGELGFICDYKTVRAVLQEKCATILFDATTQDGLHVNCISITTPNSSHLISLEQLPGGAAADYKKHICSSINSIVRIYCSVTDQDFNVCLQDFISRVKCCLTDRAPVNHATINLLEKEWGKNLVELKCNIHPLEAVSREIIKALASFESPNVQNILPGDECIAKKIMSGLNLLRHSDKDGEVMAFKCFLDKLHLKKSTIPRLKGNRIQIMFSLGVLYHIYRNELLEFVLGFDNLTPQKRNLQLAFQEEIAALELQVLGVISKLFSAPWTKTFYTLSTIPMSKGYMDIVRGVMSKVEDSIQNPHQIMCAQKDFFGNDLLVDDEIRKVFTTPSNPELFLKMTTACFQKILEVLCRQYKQSFFSVAGASDEVLLSARVHTMEVESMIGEFCEQKRRAPSASTPFISNRIKAKRSKVNEFIRDMSNDRLSFILDLALPYSREEGFRQTMAKVDISLEIINRLEKKKSKMESLIKTN